MLLYEKSNLVPGRILSRYKRFLADIALEDGSVVTAHTTNTGSMKSCWEAGDPVLLEASANPARKLPFTLVACQRQGCWVGVETGMPNKLTVLALQKGQLKGLPDLHDIRTEVRYGQENSRIDVLAYDAAGRNVYIEVKNTTLREGHHVLFPDAVSARGAKHLRELQSVVAEGHRGVILFFVQRGDVTVFDAAREIDPVYARHLDEAFQAGVEVLPMQSTLEALPKEDTWSLRWLPPCPLPWEKRTP